ncbi:hypothetical protein CF319_g2667 [Tilletia indica]|nr:hypothetical protein CF319_g2667 [Tilletia indica]
MSSSQRGPSGSDPVYPHSHSIASASTASSLTQPNTPYRDNDDSSHPYPPPINNNDDLDLDLDLEDPDALADDVAFIQKQRSSTTPKNTRFLIKLKGFFTVLAIISAALLLIPLLQWLSSAPFASSPLGEAIASIPGIKNTTIFNITIGSTPSLPQDHEDHTPAIPEVGTLTGNLPSASKYGASADTAVGSWGLGRAKAGGFQTQFYLPGWGDALSASKVLGIPAPPKNDAGQTSAADHLRPLTMDNVLDGTFYAARSDLAWCPEDPDEGVFSHVDPITKDIILEDVTHARLNRTGVGKVAIGGGYSLFITTVIYLMDMKKRPRRICSPGNVLKHEG